jgi:probable F420-dependent oxidoreductase
VPTLGAHLWSRDARSLATRGAELEAYGFTSLTVGDHLGHFPALTACAVLAQATERAAIGPLVLNNDLRHPVVLAHEAAALAELSGGRFELGLGAGYARGEYARAGIPFSPRSTRIARLAEAAAIVRRLLAGETVDFEGEHYRVRGQALPPPTHSVPLLIGGNSPAVHEVAAALADVVGLAGSPRSREGGSDYASAAVERQVTRLNALSGGRRLELEVLVQWHEVTDDVDGALTRAADALGVEPAVAAGSPYVLAGSADAIAARLREHQRRFGIGRWTVFADRPDLQPAEALRPVLERLADERPGA